MGQGLVTSRAFDVLTLPADPAVEPDRGTDFDLAGARAAGAPDRPGRLGRLRRGEPPRGRSRDRLHPAARHRGQLPERARDLPEPEDVRQRPLPDPRLRRPGHPDGREQQRRWHAGNKSLNMHSIGIEREGSRTAAGTLSRSTSPRPPW
ncbi:hypothetical protein SAM23877_2210 [Streptomyces ambofaciens ATCC 23877]|uniref:Uncharacterized protein n=1 Tax=Streptomyces ambofaciens (strain ATCC 23877 / 3486 / DSM 40053 / JCM 4204 / NBRC 12836 / NRRL B-2516) TaxID=278992 RepID=A0A0K2AQJ8_STRA7|nr:hypothetical protein SAM23877_2210 [Streptomyces ambofaciens ATCC 23877]